MNKSQKISRQGQLVSVITISVIAILLVIGLSLKKKPEVVTMETMAEEVVDTPKIPVEEHSRQIEAVFYQPAHRRVFL